MPITWTWHDKDKAIAHIRVEGSWMWRDYMTARYEIFDALDDSIKRVDFIMDMSQTSVLPPNVIMHTESVVTAPHPKDGLTILLGLNSFMNKIFQLSRRIIPNLEDQYRVAEDMESALSMIAQSRSIADNSSED